MVFCRLKSKDISSAVYSFGCDCRNPENQTGEIQFFSDGIPKVINSPKGIDEKVYMYEIGKLYGKYVKKFKSGIFPNIISYES